MFGCDSGPEYPPDRTVCGDRRSSDLGRPAVCGQPRRLSDAERVCLAVAQVLLGARSEHHWLRICYGRLRHLFPYLPKQPGCRKQLKATTPLLAAAIDQLARQRPSWYDLVLLSDATPVRPGLTLIADKGFAGTQFEDLAATGFGLRLIRPDPRSPGRHLVTVPVRRALHCRPRRRPPQPSTVATARVGRPRREPVSRHVSCHPSRMIRSKNHAEEEPKVSPPDPGSHADSCRGADDRSAQRVRACCPDKNHL